MSDYSKEKLASGILLSQGLKTTIEFLEWYIKWLKENQSYSKMLVLNLEEIVKALGNGGIEELCRLDT